MTTSDGWFKPLLKTLVNRGGRVNSSACRGMELVAEANICCRDFGVCVGMERPNDAVNEKHLGIERFLERINIGLVSLVGCAFNEVHGVSRNVSNHHFGDDLWDPGYI